MTTGFVGSDDTPWFDRLALAFKSARRKSIELGDGRTLRLSSIDERLLALSAAVGVLKRLPDEVRVDRLRELMRELQPTDTGEGRRPMLTWEELAEVRDLGFSVGAHTVSHPILSRVSPERAWQEIEGSRSAIEDALGVPPSAFAYPNGGLEDYSESVTALVEKAGFTCAVTTRRGVNTAQTPPLELRRGGPWERQLPMYALKLAHYYLTGV